MYLTYALPIGDAIYPLDKENIVEWPELVGIVRLLKLVQSMSSIGTDKSRSDIFGVLHDLTGMVIVLDIGSAFWH